MYCCVPFCTSDRKKQLGISFHEFPANDNRREAWLKAISRKDFLPNDKSASSVVCSLHFLDSDYTLGTTKLRRLKRDVVPSVFSDYPSYMQPQKPPKRRKLERGLQNFTANKDNASNSSSCYSSASGSAKSTDHSSTPACRFPLAPEGSQLLHAPLGGNEEASLQGAGYDTGHSSQTSASRVPMFVPKDDLVLGGAKPSAQDTVGELQRSSDTVECAAQTCDGLLPRKQSDTKMINRMRVQIFRKADAVRRLQRENSRLKKKLSGYENHSIHSALKGP